MQWPTDGYTTVEVKGKPNGGKAYDNSFDPKNGVIIADDNNSSQDSNRGDKDKQLFLTDIWLQGMAKRAENAKTDVAVKYIFRHNIINTATKDIIQEAYTRTKTDLKAHTWTLKDNKDDFLAMT